jgi:hypothetical protein
MFAAFVLGLLLIIALPLGRPCPEPAGKRQDRGILLKNTDVSFVKAPGSNIRLAGASGRGGYAANSRNTLSHCPSPFPLLKGGSFFEERKAL